MLNQLDVYSFLVLIFAYICFKNSGSSISIEKFRWAIIV